jgi:hypothetical protein
MSLFTVIALYSLIGVIFGLFFVFLGYSKLDPAAQEASFAVRLLWLPASIILWPILLARIARGESQ